jgi:hypothetical protein
MLRIQSTLGRVLMRRLAAAIAVTSVLALAACSTLPAGVDGDLTNGWSSMPAATGTLPTLGGCYDGTDQDMMESVPFPCSTPHSEQVVKIGTFTGDDAGLAKSPAAGSTAIRDAFAECGPAANAYLGGDFHGGLVAVSVLVPDQKAWGGGARWFACEVDRVEAVDDLVPVETSGSLQGVLAKPGPLRLSCVAWNVHGDALSDFRTSSCAKAHGGEYAGAFHVTPEMAVPSATKFNSLAASGCEGVVAKFLGLSGSRDNNRSVSWAWTYTTKTAWLDGDQTIRCYAAAVTRDNKFVGSVKGIGLRTAKG